MGGVRKESARWSFRRALIFDGQRASQLCTIVNGLSGTTYRDGIRDPLNCSVPDHLRGSDRFDASVPNRDPDTVQFCRDPAKAAVKCIKKANVCYWLRARTGVVPWAWYGRRKQIDAWRRQSICADFSESLRVVDDFGAWPRDRAADPVPYDQTVDALISRNDFC